MTMSNIIKAILNIYNCKVYNTGKHYKAKNRANNMGDALEHFIKDSFANSFEYNEEDAIKAHSEVFSYLGNQNNPPDIILKNGDAMFCGCSSFVEGPSALPTLETGYEMFRCCRLSNSSFKTILDTIPSVSSSP